MSFLGKVYKSEKHENLKEFFKAIGTPEAQITTLLQTEPIIKLTKNGDTYTFSNTGARNPEVTFANGGKVVDKYDDNVTDYIVANKPDIVLTDRSQRQAVLVDITIPHDENLVKAEKDKLSKYLDLAHEFTSTFTLDGNVLTQKQNSNDGKISFTVIREFSEDSLKEKITAAGWDGVAYRYFKV